MAEWIVEGTDRDGRTPRRETVEAPTAEAAKAEAYKRGVIPDAAHRVRSSAPVEVASAPPTEPLEVFDRDDPEYQRLLPGEKLRRVFTPSGQSWRTQYTDWLVRGAMRETGVPVEIVVQAADPAQAQGIAHSKGLLVRDITQASAAVGRPGGPPMLIEKTSKKFKGPILVSALVVIASVPACMVGVNDPAIGGAGVLMFWGGLLMFIVFRAVAWWHHG